ncbi:MULTISPECIES: PDR/VanB family oxidoreductase [Pseudonocardia]|uniref:Phenoxybenzoate dioxygenase subunit beta n=2 Tax=Pseudonocardia TaxID=1847 RepID=A0A1Y2MYN4_PSEAH|nr:MULTISPECIES: PDR/VanB family oxidoreductase [Pseudonocardia]OSY40089.1 Phenoxybenzoate dioxygenase subunit beta [Pseudonocardia autotrophica]TDN72965.1 ferredoxin-NADP reductase [Pseudonocardia autotrophica]BBG03685.1 ferredoxin [Pseudonocardia autotrophica]GEC29206.1 ferredoxin [Pseudonocardia saturnea]
MTDLDLVVADKQTAADGVALLTLRRADGGELPAWEPGAHVDLVLGADLVRQYSLCGDPADRSGWQVAVLREQSGRGGSAHVHDVLAVGDTVAARGPRNHFPLLPSASYVFVAGGIGITPILPMLAAAQAAGADWRLVYGGRTRGSMAFTELAERYPGRVEIRPQDETGLLDLAGIIGAAADRPVYCCGPEGLLGAVEKECAERGLAVHLERFTPKDGVLDGPRDAFEVELAGTGEVITVPADRSVLDVLEDAGVEVLSSCQEGTCGTCETGVLAGVPEHRDSLLTDEEQEAGDTMMICVSRSRSPRLVLDL